jgi:hypothetical protein
MTADGILVLYHYSPPYASTVIEHAQAFERHSRFPVWLVNVEHGFPPALRRMTPTVMVLHYSLFGSARYLLGEQFREFLDRTTGSYRIAFFQDEHYYCRQRFAFIDQYRIDCVYTLVDPEHHDAVYGRLTYGPRLVHTIPGYVSDDLVRLARERSHPDAQRRVDVGYRARSLPYYMGRGGQEKREIGVRFKERARDLDLQLDIETAEESRLYGDRWIAFLADCRAVLGVEAGVSIFDLDDTVRHGYERLVAGSPDISFDEVSERLLKPWEGNIPYRTVSPRHFEAAAFRVTQILFEGRYSGVLEPMVHFLPLRKDFSNFDEIVRLYRDPDVRRTLTDRAYSDLIASGRYSYRRFVSEFDDELEACGLRPAADATEAEHIRRLLARGARARRLRARVRARYRGWAERPFGRRVRDIARGVLGWSDDGD